MEVMFGSSGKPDPINLSPLQEERLHPLEHDNHGIRTLTSTRQQLLRRRAVTNRAAQDGLSKVITCIFVISGTNDESNFLDNAIVLVLLNATAAEK